MANKKTGIAFLNETRYRQAQDSIVAAGGDKEDKKVIFEAYKAIDGKYAELPLGNAGEERAFESFHCYDKFVLESETEKKEKKETKKLGGAKKKKR